MKRGGGKLQVNLMMYLINLCEYEVAVYFAYFNDACICKLIMYTSISIRSILPMIFKNNNLIIVHQNLGTFNFKFWLIQFK